MKKFSLFRSRARRVVCSLRRAYQTCGLANLFPSFESPRFLTANVCIPVCGDRMGDINGYTLLPAGYRQLGRALV